VSIQSTARLRIHDGKLDEFKAVANRCIESVRAKDKGTLQYDWFLSEDGSECVVRESYQDSPSVFEHMENLGPILGDLMDTCEMELEIFGEPSDDLAEVLVGFGARIYPPLDLTTPESASGRTASPGADDPPRPRSGR
jgi:quinol monooxygenase YgiN